MALINIDILLEKYFDGSTSIEQEKQLTNYFSGNDVAQHHEQYQELFGFFEKEKQTTYNQEIILKNKSMKINWFAFAASMFFVVGMTAFYLMNNNSANPENGLGTYKSPEIAFAETQKALQMLSSNVNVGINSVAYINEYQTAKSKIFIE